jgi:hypothetical protein
MGFPTTIDGLKGKTRDDIKGVSAFRKPENSRVYSSVENSV